MGAAAALAIVAVGVAVGLLSGLIGIGGGVLIVPFLYFFYGHPELFGVVVRPEAQVVLAHGTSLFVILPTSVRGAIAYHAARLVEWRAVWPIGLASVASAILGARLALVLPPEALKLAFGLLLVLSGARLAVKRDGPEDGAGLRAPRLTLPVTALTGLATGLFSALLGVGGGIVSIPLMIHVVGLDVRKVAATSMGIIGITAAAGVATYMASGAGEAGLPPLSVGYVDVAAGALMFLGSVASVRWGAALNQRLRPRALEILFAATFVAIGVRMVVANAAAFPR